MVYIEGYLKTRSWDSPEGVRIFKTEIVTNDMIMLSKRPEGEEDYASTDADQPVDDNTFDPGNISDIEI